MLEFEPSVASYITRVFVTDSVSNKRYVETVTLGLKFSTAVWFAHKEMAIVIKI